MLQIIFNGFVTGIVVTLPALAITLLFGVLKFPNFAVGSMLTLAAYNHRLPIERKAEA